MANIIKVTHEVSDQFLLDVMTNTVESGAINYWASIQNVMRLSHTMPDIYEFQVADAEDASELADDLRKDGTREFEIPDIIANDKNLWYVIDKDAIVRGINTVLNDTQHWSGDEGKILTRPFDVSWTTKQSIMRAVADDDADIDATGCDVIIQAVMFGELVYG